MKTRDVTKLQYDKGQQIKAADVNARMKEAFSTFNIMGPTDVAPLTTGQFRVFEPRKGLKLVPVFNDNTKWFAAGSCTPVDVDTYRCTSNAVDGLMVLGVAAGPAPVAIFTVGHRYVVYAYVKNEVAQSGKVRFFNVGTTTELIYSANIAGNAESNIVFSFQATDFYFAIGGLSNSAINPLDLTVKCPLAIGAGTGATGIYIYDWDDNMWLIPNYCGFVSPSTDRAVTTLGAGPIDLRTNHYLMCQAITKEVEAANEVLKYL
jgi:hypothetical protein